MKRTQNMCTIRTHCRGEASAS